MDNSELDLAMSQGEFSFIFNMMIFTVAITAVLNEASTNVDDDLMVRKYIRAVGVLLSLMCHFLAI